MGATSMLLSAAEPREFRAQAIFTWNGGESQMATRKNDDGTISFVTADPPLSGLELVNAERDGKRCLTLRDAQHEYVFTEAS
jgi:hypothetical protein